MNNVCMGQIQIPLQLQTQGLQVVSIYIYMYIYVYMYTMFVIPFAIATSRFAGGPMHDLLKCNKSTNQSTHQSIQ